LARLLLASVQAKIFMNRLLTVATLVVATVPLYAHGQEPNAAALKAEAQRVVSLISGDKFKTQTYCEIGDLSEQLQAEEDKDSQRVGDLSQKIAKLEEKLGAEYIALVRGLRDIDPNSRDSQEIDSIIERLDVFCGD
jgi:flagellar motility protein MotE (MotC chaperone)